MVRSPRPCHRAIVNPRPCHRAIAPPLPSYDRPAVLQNPLCRRFAKLPTFMLLRNRVVVAADVEHGDVARVADGYDVTPIRTHGG